MAEELKLLTQGAEGCVYTCKWIDHNAVVKYRFPKKYRHPELDSHITRERIKAEARSLVRCRMIGINVPALYDVNLDTNELVMENVNESVSVRQYICEKGKISDLNPLADNIGLMLAKLHANNIIHGDLTTSNMLIVEHSTVYLIDFGLSYISEQIEDKAVDLYVLERAILSTHPNSDDFMERILKTYKTGSKKSPGVLTRLADVQMRGRKKLCFG
ncbi:UNVERIFIED_CONTAM: hypothetical protein GTU68_015129 [Idotea baltica]|nr:hypothetical protein [Idotea baltica]